MKLTPILVATTLTLTLFPHIAAADDSSKSGDTGEHSATRPFAAGLMPIVMIPLDHLSRVTAAEVDNGVLHVTERPSSITVAPVASVSWDVTKRVAIGVFAALVPHDVTSIHLVAGGAEVSLREGATRLMFGVGAYYEGDAQILAPGLMDGQPLPTGETVLFQKTHGGGLLFVAGVVL